MFKGIFSYTEIGKAIAYVEKVALDLIKARRQSGHTEKVLYAWYRHYDHVFQN